MLPTQQMHYVLQGVKGHRKLLEVTMPQQLTNTLFKKFLNQT